MKRGSFIFDGVNSEDVKTIIQSRPILEAPARKVEQKSTYGVDGTVPYDENAYDNTVLDLSMFTDGDDAIGDREKLYNLLDTRGVYKDFIPYFDPGKIYRVMLNDKVKFDNHPVYLQRQVVTASFTVKPYKYLVGDAHAVITGSPVTTAKVTNPTNYISQPKIIVTGSGPVTLKVNGIDFNIKNVLNNITLDSERYSAYQDINGALTSMNYQVATREYPIFNPGDNYIVVTGNVTQLYIEPRWRSLV